jgi:hypothetical protein
MPGFLLHQNAVVTCSHAGKATPTAFVPNVLVMGQPIIVRTAPWMVAGCAFPPPPAANGPCVTALFTSSAVRVFSYGMPVLLQDSLAICAPTGTPLIISATQTRVFGM